jgi:hypothetical protein
VLSDYSLRRDFLRLPKGFESFLKLPVDDVGCLETPGGELRPRRHLVLRRISVLHRVNSFLYPDL